MEGKDLDAIESLLRDYEGGELFEAIESAIDSAMQGVVAGCVDAPSENMFYRWLKIKKVFYVASKPGKAIA